jgi:hypothetical protein
MWVGVVELSGSAALIVCHRLVSKNMSSRLLISTETLNDGENGEYK